MEDVLLEEAVADDLGVVVWLPVGELLAPLAVMLVAGGCAFVDVRATNEDLKSSHLAITCALGGSISIRPTPESQQLGHGGLQQYDVSKPVTFEHEISSPPPLSRTI